MTARIGSKLIRPSWECSVAQPVKVRFAPSPTGFLHIGGMRSALFNWLYARKTNGQFILRLEDTDRERYVPEAVEQIQASHEWLGLLPDETAVQSERLEIYMQHADKLIKSGQLYRCWCGQDRLDQLREQAKAHKQAFKYDRYCLTHPQADDQPHVLRFLVPDQPATVTWNDAVRGHMEFAIADIDDFVAIKSDGYPTYNFANVVDDHVMGITHVLRAEEFLSSTPKHLLIYAAFSWQPPVFAHLPQVLGPDGRSKLSKRDGAQSVLEYRDQGYLPEAVINFMALLGWNEGEGTTKEVYTAEELIKAFSLERIHTSPAVFDPERLLWLNGLWIRQQLTEDELLRRCHDWWPAAAKPFDNDFKRQVLKLVRDRLKVLSELPELTGFFFADPAVPPLHQSDQQHLSLVAEAIGSFKRSRFTPSELEAKLRQLAEDLELKPGQLFMPIRQALTGSTVSPGLFETMAVLGRDTCLRRLQAATTRKKFDKR